MQQNETTPCWACGGPTAPTSAYAPFEYLACARCGLAFRPFQPTAEVHAEYTSGRYAERYDELFMGADQLPQRRRESRRRLEFAGEGLPGRRVFDVGAGGGIFVAVAREAGWDADGVEPDPGFVEHARRVSGVELRQGTLEDLALDPHSIDLATLWHVLEHLVDPADELRRLRG